MTKTKMLLVSVFAILILASFANAGCVVTDRTVMYFQPERFARVVQVCHVNQQQGAAMMLDDINAGIAVVVEPGTRLDDAAPLPSDEKTIVCRIGGLLMIGPGQDVRCK